MSSEDVVDQIRRNAWRQGQILPTSLHASIAELCGRNVKDDEAFVVVTQSCILVHADLELEPHVEVVPASPIVKADGVCMNGRSPRRLHLGLTIGGVDTAFEFLARDRLLLPRKLLADGTADSARTVTAPGLRTLIAWLCARYSRVALPDTFQLRIKPIQSKLRNAAKRLTHASEVFIALNTWEEDAAEYQIELVFVMPSERFSDPKYRADTQSAIDEIAKSLKTCAGVILEDDPVLVADDDFTLADAKMLHLWGDFDYVSLADQAAHVAGA